MSSDNRNRIQIILTGILTGCVGVLAGVALSPLLSPFFAREVVIPPTLRDDPEILREQLSRNRSFFLEGQDRVENSFCIVVGVGGVGSHAAHMLARSGVGRLRLIDFDNVTLSSLNRHATATRNDVGTPKVVALASALARVVPSCVVEPVQSLMCAERCEELLSGNPDFVLDCIDDRDTKVALLQYCKARDLTVLASLGAGGKADPTRLRFMDLALVPSGSMDPLGTAIKATLRKAGMFSAQFRDGGVGGKGASAAPKSGHEDVTTPTLSGITCILSVEEPRATLLPLPIPEGLVGASTSPEDFGAMDNFRVRIIPVLGTMPAMFGQAMAAYVLCKLAGNGHALKPLESTGHAPGSSQRLLTSWNAWESSHYPRDEGWGCTCGLSGEEVDFLLSEAWHARSALSHLRLGVRGVKLQLIRWRPFAPSLPSNLVLLSDDEASALSEAVEVDAVWTLAREAIDLGWDFNKSGGGGPAARSAVEKLEREWEKRARAAVGDEGFSMINERLVWVRIRWGC